MKTTTATPQNITAAAVVRTLAQCLTLAATYGAQRTAAALRAAHRATIAVCQWLNSRHNFTDEEDPVIMTGWQYLGFGVLVMFVAMVMCIKW